MKRRRVEESADGLALMTSSVTSSYSADGLSLAVARISKLLVHPDARGSDVVEEISSRKLLFTSRCYLEIAIAKRCRLHKLIRQRFALALKIQQEDFALITSRKIQSRATIYCMAIESIVTLDLPMVLVEAQVRSSGYILEELRRKAIGFELGGNFLDESPAARHWPEGVGSYLDEGPLMLKSTRVIEMKYEYIVLRMYENIE
ncbi:hypothetical protein F511_09881 [Dorcoceras hygrometricum]|uniref:Uncharacterized protein n=1 Tax=Dorcoceras hygrometricum TaxID=472368 RepID=A0A2Z7CVJ7_9LAMI|nr:hypothetical protein F511_09881 [Dorcoceras hygrometricum]